MKNYNYYQLYNFFYHKYNVMSCHGFFVFIYFVLLAPRFIVIFFEEVHYIYSFSINRMANAIRICSGIADSMDGRGAGRVAATCPLCACNGAKGFSLHNMR